MVIVIGFCATQNGSESIHLSGYVRGARGFYGDIRPYEIFFGVELVYGLRKVGYGILCRLFLMIRRPCKGKQSIKEITV